MLRFRWVRLGLHSYKLRAWYRDINFDNDRNEANKILYSRRLSWENNPTINHSS
jgi:hypothetical protein